MTTRTRQNSQTNLMAKIIKYNTAQDSDPRGLDKRVNTLIEMGYQPYGSPYSAFNGRSINLCQAMVKVEGDAPDDEGSDSSDSSSGGTGGNLLGGSSSPLQLKPSS